MCIRDRCITFRAADTDEGEYPAHSHPEEDGGTEGASVGEEHYLPGHSQYRSRDRGVAAEAADLFGVPENPWDVDGGGGGGGRDRGEATEVAALHDGTPLRARPPAAVVRGGEGSPECGYASDGPLAAAAPRLPQCATPPPHSATSAAPHLRAAPPPHLRAHLRPALAGRWSAVAIEVVDGALTVVVDGAAVFEPAPTQGACLLYTSPSPRD